MCRCTSRTGGAPWAQKVEDPLEHFAIYPTLEDMDLGVDPRNTGTEREWFRGELQKLLHGAGRAGRSDWTVSLACALFATLLLKSDEALKNDVTQAILDINSDAARMGQEIADYVRTKGLRTPGRKASAFRVVKRAFYKTWRIKGKVRLRVLEVGRGAPGPWYSYRPYAEV